jgi:benzoate membrane transport protein
MRTGLMRVSLFSAALVAALVGYGSTIALVLSAAAAVGANAAQTASWVFAICLAKAIGSAFLGWYARVPVVLAWSTPGAALIAATSGISIHQAVGAFVLAGMLIALTGAIRPLGRVVAMIPDGIAAGMLAGVLLPFVLKLAVTLATAPFLILPVAALFALVRLWNPSFAVLAALSLGVVLGLSGQPLPRLDQGLPGLVFIAPEWNASVLIGLGLPLYLVTMASQNLPGFATLRAAGFEPPVRPALTVTGGLSTIGAFFGAHTVSMAAITAAICLGDDVHPVRSQRWKVSLAYAGVWIGLGFSGPVMIALIADLPASLVTALVALALLGPLTGALTGAFAHAPQRFAAAVTLTVTASGVAFYGIGAAFWGLLAGLLSFALEQCAPRIGRR